MNPTNMLAGKVVAITGAGRGIGRAIALLCAQEGAAVVVNDFGASLSGDALQENPGAEVVSEITAAGGRAFANAANIASPDGAASVIADAVAQFGRIDAVVNNAGVARDAMFHKMSVADWYAVVEVHLNGSFYVARAAAPYFREQNSGAFVHITSTSGLIGNVGQSNYAAAKMGIVGLSTSIALDMRRFGVRSNCIAPFAWSRMTANIPQTTDAEKRRVERLKTMTAEQVAPMAVFLCSDASSEVNAQIFSVRRNEIFVFSVPRPVRSVHRSEGWSAGSIATDFLPAARASLQPLQVSADVFAWDPV
jgi:NAD(P)-dependent dehydrogenase (short-subunit alcohol dehydrogenase family)